MWATRLRYTGLGILLLGITVGLLLAWRTSPVLFGIIVGFIVLVVTTLFLVRDGWRQTSPESLAARGFRPDSGLNAMDPGLRREFSPIIPAAVSRRISGNPTRRPVWPGQSPLEAAGLADGTKRCSRVPLSPSLRNGGQHTSMTCSSSWTSNWSDSSR